MGPGTRNSESGARNTATFFLGRRVRPEPAMPIPRFRFTGLLAALLAACAATPTLAIINGTLETGFPAVGVVTDGVTAMNSAVLIAPSWVLTSASFATICDDGAFYVGIDYAAPDAVYDFAAVFPHPNYDPDTAANNIALILLAAPVTGVSPLPYLTASSGITVGSSVVYVGYGATSSYDFSNTLRRSCTNAVENYDLNTFLTYFDGDGPYIGDQGGPALVNYAGTWQVGGIISLGDSEGTEYTISTRVSAYAAFIATVMAANPPSAVGEPPAVARPLDAAPNPFNPATEIAFGLDEPAACTVTVFDLRGRRVAGLAAGRFEAGRHVVRWDGRCDAGGMAASGTYLVVLRDGEGVRACKVMLAK